MKLYARNGYQVVGTRMIGDHAYYHMQRDVLEPALAQA